jgi:predicted nucleic acid-binding protein
MIHLDTNYLIGMVSLNSPLGAEVTRWLKSGEKLGTSAIAWTEFLTGPLSVEQLRRAEVILGGEIASFGETEADCAAQLYNRTGRKRATRLDCMIAATAICSSAPLATQNRKDFTPFVTAGLRLTSAH